MNEIKKITDEKYNLELKREVNFTEPKNYLKSVSAFANGYDVGYIVFGIEDGTKNIVGIKDMKKSYEEITNRIKTRIEPSIIPIIDIIDIDNKKLILVKVIPGNHTPYYYVNKGTRIAYVRKGDQDVETNSLELNELILRGKNIGWDEQIGAELYKNFTFDCMKDYFKNIKGYDIDKKDLISFGLIKDNKLTNAAILFSDQNPNKSSFISCTRWDGLGKIVAKDDIEFYGSILNQIDKAIDFVKKHVSIGWIRDGELARKELSEYDMSALRERNYKCRGTSSISIKRYASRTWNLR